MLCRDDLNRLACLCCIHFPQLLIICVSSHVCANAVRCLQVESQSAFQLRGSGRNQAVLHNPGAEVSLLGSFYGATSKGC